MMILFGFIVIFLLCVGNAIAYKLFISIFPILTFKYIMLIRIIFFILTVCFPLASIISHYYNSIFSRIFYTFSSIWLGFLFYIFLAAILYSIVLFLNHFIFLNFEIIYIGKILFFVAILAGIYGIYNAQNIVVTKVNVSIPDLPESWKGKRVVFLSDIHLGQINGIYFSKKIFRKIQELNPDIIFNGGDLYDGVSVDALKVIEPISNLKPKLGHYFVTGNHEEYGDIVAYKNAISQAGIYALNNEVVNIDGVNIVGVDYSTTTKVEDFHNILKNLNIDHKGPTILIKHVPFDLQVASDMRIDLQLSGHTHRAQIWPLNYITKIVYKGYDYGLKNFNNMQVLVTDGLGTWGPPMRVGTNSEIVLITFK